MQIIPRDVPGSFSESFQTGLQQLLQAKIGQLQQRHQTNEFGKAYEALGLPKELINLPQSAQSKLLEELSPVIASKLSSRMQSKSDPITRLQQAVGLQQPKPQNQSIINAMQGLDDKAKPLDAKPLQASSQIQQQPVKQLLEQPIQKPEARNINQVKELQAPQVKESQRIMTRSEEARQAKLEAANAKLQEKEKRIATKNERLNQLLQEKRQLMEEREKRILTRSEQEEKRRIESDLRREKLEQAKAERELAKADRLEQHRINKELGPIHREIVKSAHGARDDDRRLNRMEELVNKGKLSDPWFHSALNTLEHGIFGFGINLHSLESPDSQEFDKLSKEFLKNAKNVFGSRITDNDVRVFLKMVPDLSQSKEGKLAIIHNMRAYNEAIRVKKKAADKVLAANNGKIPFDYEEQVDRIADPELDSLAKLFTTEKRIKPKIENEPKKGLLASVLPDSVYKLFS